MPVHEPGCTYEKLSIREARTRHLLDRHSRTGDPERRPTRNDESEAPD
jgi:hypothetical protein